jgi:hypothetical protein
MELGFGERADAPVECVDLYGRPSLTEYATQFSRHRAREGFEAWVPRATYQQ